MNHHAQMLASAADAGIVERASEALERWPVEVLGISAIALFGGLVLWVAGARLVRPIFAVIGLLAGGLLGYLIAPALGPEDVGGVAVSTIGLAGGGLVGLIIAALLYRLAVAGSAGLALGAAGLLGTAVFVTANPDPGRSPPPPRERSSLLLPGVALPGQSRETTRTEQARLVASLVRAEAGDRWDTWTIREKAILAAGLAVPAALGVAAGLFAPRRTAAVISAPLGAALWLGGAAGLMASAGGEPSRIVGSTPTAWAIAWGAVTLAGLALQLLLIRRKKKSGKDAGGRSDAEAGD